jgi:hypothetical protein
VCGHSSGDRGAQRGPHHLGPILQPPNYHRWWPGLRVPLHSQSPGAIHRPIRFNEGTYTNVGIQCGYKGLRFLWAKYSFLTVANLQQNPEARSRNDHVFM